MDETSSIIEATASLAWPLIAVVAIVLLLPSIRRVVRDRPFTIKIASSEMSAQEASEALLKQIEDLQGATASSTRSPRRPWTSSAADPTASPS